jgi:GAF domain-containing protein
MRALARMSQRRVWLLETLHTVNASITNSDDVEGAFQQIVDEINARFQFTSVAIGIVDDDTVDFRWISYEDRPIGFRIPISCGVCGRVIRTGIAELVTDVSKDPEYVEVASIVKREIAVPIRVHGAVYGVLNIEATDRIPLGDEELDVMKTLAGSLGLASRAASSGAFVRAAAHHGSYRGASPGRP